MLACVDVNLSHSHQGALCNDTLYHAYYNKQREYDMSSSACNTSWHLERIHSCGERLHGCSVCFTTSKLQHNLLSCNASARFWYFNKLKALQLSTGLVVPTLQNPTNCLQLGLAAASENMTGLGYMALLSCTVYKTGQECSHYAQPCLLQPTDISGKSREDCIAVITATQQQHNSDHVNSVVFCLLACLPTSYSTAHYSKEMLHAY